MSSRAGLTASPHYPQTRHHGEGDSSGPCSSQTQFAALLAGDLGLATSGQPPAQAGSGWKPFTT